MLNTPITTLSKPERLVHHAAHIDRTCRHDWAEEWDLLFKLVLYPSIFVDCCRQYLMSTTAPSSSDPIYVHNVPNIQPRLSRLRAAREHLQYLFLSLYLWSRPHRLYIRSDRWWPHRRHSLRQETWRAIQRCNGQHRKVTAGCLTPSFIRAAMGWRCQYDELSCWGLDERRSAGDRGCGEEVLRGKQTSLGCHLRLGFVPTGGTRGDSGPGCLCSREVNRVRLCRTVSTSVGIAFSCMEISTDHETKLFESQLHSQWLYLNWILAWWLLIYRCAVHYTESIYLIPRIVWPYA